MSCRNQFDLNIFHINALNLLCMIGVITHFALRLHICNSLSVDSVVATHEKYQKALALGSMLPGSSLKF